MKKGKWIQVRVSEEELEAWKRVAEAYGISLSECVRVGLGRLEGEVKGVDLGVGEEFVHI